MDSPSGGSLLTQSGYPLHIWTIQQHHQNSPSGWSFHTQSKYPWSIQLTQQCYEDNIQYCVICPQYTETIDPTHRHPTYKPSLSTTISICKDDTLALTNTTHATTQYKVYSDGSSFEGGIGASAVLYKGNRAIKSLRYYLGPATEHMVYELELVRLLLSIFLLTGLTCQLLNTVIIGIDNQAVIKALNDQTTKPAHYLINQIHTAMEHLQQCQDRLQCKEEFHSACNQGWEIVAKSRGVFDLRIQWVPGHKDFKPNEKADEYTKETVKGNSSSPQDLPMFLRKPLPFSISALHQESKAKLQRLWARHWKASPQYQHIRKIDKSTPSKKWLQLVKPLSHKQLSIIMQLCTSQIGLNEHLYHIKWADSPLCPNCDKNTDETIHHFLFDCTKYCHECHILQQKLHHYSYDLLYLLSNPTTTLLLLKYVHSSGHLKQTFRAVC